MWGLLWGQSACGSNYVTSERDCVIRPRDYLIPRRMPFSYSGEVPWDLAGACDNFFLFKMEKIFQRRNGKVYQTFEQMRFDRFCETRIKGKCQYF
jgi:hypothetical protein